MKILISTLLLSVVAFLHFGELNASDINEAVPSEPSGRQPRLPESKPKDKKKMKNSKVKPDKIIALGNKEFGIWYSAQGIPREVRLLSAKNIIPDEEFRSKYKIEEEYVEKGGVRFVMFVMNGIVLGAQYAPALKKPEINASVINKADTSGQSHQHPSLSEHETMGELQIRRAEGNEIVLGAQYAPALENPEINTSVINRADTSESSRQYPNLSEHETKDKLQIRRAARNQIVLGAQHASVSRRSVSKVPRNPNDPNWTFNYDQREVGVWEDSAGRPRVVGFVSGNIIPNDSDIKKFGIRTQMDHQHDVFFLVHALPNGKVLGVELAPGWNPPYLQKGDHNQLTS